MARVWLPVDTQEAFVLATVTSNDQQNATLRPDHADADVTLTAHELANLHIAHVDDPAAHEDDLVKLRDVNAASILHNLKLRYSADQIYTAISSSILVAVNPYKPIDYCSSEALGALTEVEPESMAPHIFRLSRAAYAAMIGTATAQSILISGESGAGKTETTKLCMASLAEMSSSTGAATEAALDSGYLLESFGNARTVHNHNSSRFGKWVAIHFDDEQKINTCMIKSFLLEKSRVVVQGPGERNYHIFYQLLAAAAATLDAPALADVTGSLGAANLYAYAGGADEADAAADADAFSRTLEQLGSLGFTPEQQRHLVNVLAAILALGNIAFEGEEGARLTSSAEPLAQAARLLAVGPPALESALVSRKVASGRGSSYTVPLTQSQCVDTRDALAKALYASVFDWIIARLNAHVQTIATSPFTDEDERFVGILDVFGFENFDYNSFEQLCINYTNEKLQGQFMDSLVRLQQLDYSREGIDCADVSFPDNREQLALIESRQGLLSMLDEECALPAGSEEAYVEKLHRMHAENPLYSKPVRGGAGARRRSVLPTARGKALLDEKSVDLLQFSVSHYAGRVTYTAAEWMDKNRGFLQPELSFLMSTSDCELVAEGLFDGVDGGSRGADSKKASTVSATFRSSLRQLSATLLQTSAHYVRCIKPNMAKVPGVFDGHFIERQLRYTGVAAVVEVQRSGYPISILQADFCSRYRCCAFAEPAALAPSVDQFTMCGSILLAAQRLLDPDGASWLDAKAAALGKTKVFLRDTVARELERARQAVFDEASLAAQAGARRRLAVRVTHLMRAHAPLAAKARSALDAKELAAAAAALDELRSAWDATSIIALAGGAAERLSALHRELGELEAELSGLSAAAAAEEAVLPALRAAIDAGDLVALRVEMQAAMEVSAGLMAALTEAMAEGDALLAAEEARLREAEAAATAAGEAAARAAAQQEIDEIKRREEEATRQVSEREEVARAAREEGADDDGEGAMARVELRGVRQRPGMGLGADFDGANTVVSLVKGGAASQQGLLRLGDVVVSVNGVNVQDKKCLSAVPEEAETLDMVVLRVKASDNEPSGAAAPASEDLVELEGSLYAVATKGGRMVGKPRKRYVMLQGTSLLSYGSEGGAAAGSEAPSSITLRDAACTLPPRSADEPAGPKAFAAFGELRKFPLMISWPKLEEQNELVLAAATSTERADWATAIKDAIHRAKEGAPVCGWLHKEGGRKSGLAMKAWKRRWFVLSTEKASLTYYESPHSKAPKGVIALKGGDAFVPKKLAGVGSHKHCFCVVSREEGVDKKAGPPQKVCTILSARSSKEVVDWVKSLSHIVRKGLVKSTKVKPSQKLKAAAPQAAGAAAVNLQSGSSLNLEQLRSLDPETLATMRIKQLKAVLENMGVDSSTAVEKNELVALIVKNRKT